MNQKIEIHQIFYRDDQRDLLDLSFLPYNNIEKKYPYNYEYAVFFDLYKNANWNELDFLGAVSWKFYQKTGMNGDELKKQILANPGFDVYFVNPFPELSVYRNVWEHGQNYHPKLIELTKQLLKECGYSETLLKIDTPPNRTAYCNYWVGNKNFWDQYMKFLAPIWEYVSTKQTPLTEGLEELAGPRSNAPFLPYIFERLFSTFLSLHNINCKSIQIPEARLTSAITRAPLKDQILRASKMESHADVSFWDRKLLEILLSAHRARHNYLVIMKKNKKYVQSKY